MSANSPPTTAATEATSHLPPPPSAAATHGTASAAVVASFSAASAADHHTTSTHPTVGSKSDPSAMRTIRTECSASPPERDALSRHRSGIGSSDDEISAAGSAASSSSAESHGSQPPRPPAPTPSSASSVGSAASWPPNPSLRYLLGDAALRARHGRLQQQCRMQQQQQQQLSNSHSKSPRFMPLLSAASASTRPLHPLPHTLASSSSSSHTHAPTAASAFPSHILASPAPPRRRLGGPQPTPRDSLRQLETEAEAGGEMLPMSARRALAPSSLNSFGDAQTNAPMVAASSPALSVDARSRVLEALYRAARDPAKHSPSFLQVAVPLPKPSQQRQQQPQQQQLNAEQARLLILQQSLGAAASASSASSSSLHAPPPVHPLTFAAHAAHLSAANATLLQAKLALQARVGYHSYTGFDAAAASPIKQQRATTPQALRGGDASAAMAVVGVIPQPSPLFAIASASAAGGSCLLPLVSGSSSTPAVSMAATSAPVAPRAVSLDPLEDRAAARLDEGSRHCHGHGRGRHSRRPSWIPPAAAASSAVVGSSTASSAVASASVSTSGTPSSSPPITPPTPASAASLSTQPSAAAASAAASASASTPLVSSLQHAAFDTAAVGVELVSDRPRRQPSFQLNGEPIDLGGGGGTGNSSASPSPQERPVGMSAAMGRARARAGSPSPLHLDVRARASSASPIPQQAAVGAASSAGLRAPLLHAVPRPADWFVSPLSLPLNVADARKPPVHPPPPAVSAASAAASAEGKTSRSGSHHSQASSSSDSGSSDSGGNSNSSTGTSFFAHQPLRSVLPPYHPVHSPAHAAVSRTGAAIAASVVGASASASPSASPMTQARTLSDSNDLNVLRQQFAHFQAARDLYSGAIDPAASSAGATRATGKIAGPLIEWTLPRTPTLSTRTVQLAQSTREAAYTSPLLSTGPAAPTVLQLCSPELPAWLSGYEALYDSFRGDLRTFAGYLKELVFKCSSTEALAVERRNSADAAGATPAAVTTEGTASVPASVPTTTAPAVSPLHALLLQSLFSPYTRSLLLPETLQLVRTVEHAQQLLDAYEPVSLRVKRLREKKVVWDARQNATTTVGATAPAAAAPTLRSPARYSYPVPVSSLLDWRSLLDLDLAIATWSDSQWLAGESSLAGAIALVSQCMEECSHKVQAVYTHIERLLREGVPETAVAPGSHEEGHKAATEPTDPTPHASPSSGNSNDSDAQLRPRPSLSSSSSSPLTALVDDLLFLTADFSALFHCFPLLLTQSNLALTADPQAQELIAWEQQQERTRNERVHSMVAAALPLDRGEDEYASTNVSASTTPGTHKHVPSASASASPAMLSVSSSPATASAPTLTAAPMRASASTGVVVIHRRGASRSHAHTAHTAASTGAHAAPAASAEAAPALAPLSQPTMLPPLESVTASPSPSLHSHSHSSAATASLPAKSSLKKTTTQSPLLSAIASEAEHVELASSSSSMAALAAAGVIGSHPRSSSFASSASPLVVSSRQGPPRSLSSKPRTLHASTRQSSLDAMDGGDADLQGPAGGSSSAVGLDRVGSEGEILLLDCDPAAPMSPVQVRRLPIGMPPAQGPRATPLKQPWWVRMLCCSSNLPPADHDQGAPRAGSISEGGWSGAATTEASTNAITRTRMDPPAISGTSLPVSPVKRGSRGGGSGGGVGGAPKHADPPLLPGGATAARLGSASLAASLAPSYVSSSSSSVAAEDDKHAPVLTAAQREEQRRVQKHLDAIQAQTLV